MACWVSTQGWVTFAKKNARTSPLMMLPTQDPKLKKKFNRNYKASQIYGEFEQLSSSSGW